MGDASCFSADPYQQSMCDEPSASDLFQWIGTQGGNLAGMIKEFGAPNAAGTPGIFGAVGNMLTGAGKLADGQYAQGGLEIMGGFGDMAAVGTQGPGVGPYLRGASAGVSIYQNVDQCAPDAPYVGNDCYSAVGDLALAGGELIPEIGPFVTAGKWGLDGLGWLAGKIDPDWGFSAGSAVGGVAHAGASGVSAVADALRPETADPLTNAKYQTRFPGECLPRFDAKKLPQHPEFDTFKPGASPYSHMF